jgi:hypothetical protein
VTVTGVKTDNGTVLVGKMKVCAITWSLQVVL